MTYNNIRKHEVARLREYIGTLLMKVVTYSDTKCTPHRPFV